MDAREIKIVETARQSYIVLWQERAPFAWATLKYYLRFLLTSPLIVAAAYLQTSLVTALALLVVMPLSMLFGFGFMTDCYRYIILEEQPARNPLKGIIDKRSLRMLLASLILFLIALGLSLIPGGAVFAATTLLKDVIPGFLLGTFSALFMLASFICIWYYMAGYLLVFPLLAVDIKVRLRDVAAFGRPLRGKLLLSMLAVLLPLILASIGLSLIGQLAGSVPINIIMAFANLAINFIMLPLLLIPTGLIFLKSEAEEAFRSSAA